MTVTQDARRQIRNASLVMAASVVLSRVIGLVREWVFAQSLGANAISDVYLSSFIIPDFLNYLMASGALSISFIPVLSAAGQTQDKNLANRLFRTVSTTMGLVFLGIIIISEIWAEPLSRFIAPGYSPEQLELLTKLVRIILPAQLFFYWGGLANSVQQMHGKFIYSALAPLIYNTFIIFCGLLFHSDLGVMGFSIGVTVGAVCSHGLLQWWGLHRLGYSVYPLLDFSPELKARFRHYLLLSFPIMLGFSLVVTDEWISKYYASFLEAKAVSYLSYARTEMRIPIAVIGQAAGIASFPYLSKLWAEKNYKIYVETLQHEIMKLWALGPLAVVIVMFCALPMTHFIYGGSKFSTEDLNCTANTLKLYGLGVFFWAFQILLSRGFYSAQRTWFPSLLGTGLSILFFPVYGYMAAKYSYFGLALTGTWGVSVYSGILWWRLKKQMKEVAAEVSFNEFYRFTVNWVWVVILAAFISFGISKLGIYQGTRMTALAEVLLNCMVVGGMALGLLRSYFKRYTQNEALF